MTPELEAHLRSFVNFPSPPGVATTIIEGAQDPNIEMARVAQVVGMDPALTTMILRIANSPLYAQRRRSENLRQPLVVLGLNATLTLALSFSLVKSLRGGKPNGSNYPYYWRRALLGAMACRALGDAVGLTLLEELFLASLLQDIGMLALDRSRTDTYRNIGEVRKDYRERQTHERKVLAAVSALVPETEKPFDTESLGATDPDVIIEQAREILMVRNLQTLRVASNLRAGPDNLSTRTLEVEEETRRDPRTGVYNRTFLDPYLAPEFESTSRHAWLRSIAFAVSTDSSGSMTLTGRRQAIGSCRARRASCAAIHPRVTLSCATVEKSFSWF